MRKNILLLIGVFTLPLCLFSQTDILGFQPDQTDPSQMSVVYKKERDAGRKYIHLAPLREADVLWSRKIWRDIDLRQKINHPLYYPQETEAQTVDRDNLFKVLYDAATYRSEISITAYANPEKDDEFKNPMEPAELINLVEGVEQELFELNMYGEDSLDLNGNPIRLETDLRKGAINLNDIKKFRLKEQWFFDKQRSVMDVRIIGICPIAMDRYPEGHPNEFELNGSERPLFWFYFPEARKVLRNAQSFNLVKNEAENRTFEDIFLKRMFSSTIVKEGNVYDRKVGQYMVGLDALLEAERIKTEIFNMEHDLWEY